MELKGEKLFKVGICFSHQSYIMTESSYSSVREREMYAKVRCVDTWGVENPICEPSHTRITHCESSDKVLCSSECCFCPGFRLLGPSGGLWGCMLPEEDAGTTRG